MLRSDLPRKQNLRTQCSREDCDQGISPSVESDPEEMRRVTVESSLHFMSHLNSIVSMTSTACRVCFEASSAIRQQFFSEVSHHGNSDSIFVMYCVSVPVLSEQNMSKPQVPDQDLHVHLQKQESERMVIKEKNQRTSG